MTVSAVTAASCAAPTGSRSGCARSRRCPGGIIRLNGKRLNLRGASVHEDDSRRAARSRRPPHPVPQPPPEPRRHDHALALPAPPRVHRGARPAGSCTGSTRRSTRSRPRTGTARRPHARSARGHADGAQQHQPPLDPHLVAGRRAGRGGAEPRHLRPERRALHPRSVEAVRELDDTRLVGLDRQSRIGEPSPRTRISTSTCSG